MLDLNPILDSRLSTGTKGVPPSGEGVMIRDVAAQGWNLLDGSIPMPAAVLRSSALHDNLMAFQTYIDQAGVKLAPHGKTSMCPQLFDRQLQAGAWGMTVATFAQACTALRYGVKRLLIANELVGETEIRALAAVEDAHILSLVDSVAGVERIEAILQNAGVQKPFGVLVELGIEGGRTGARGAAVAMDVARRVAQSPVLALAGVEGYEGLIVTGDAVADAARVDGFLRDLKHLFETCRAEGLFVDAPILSAGGSAYFDLVARGLKTEGVTTLVRSGCYLTHDTGFYQRLLAHVGERAVQGSGLGPAPALKPALEVWAQVVSRPEAGLILVNAGRRDLSDDSGLPRVEVWARPGKDAQPQPVSGWNFTRMNDQHGYVRVPEDAAVAVGDYIALSISHPCTTFDRWPLLLEVDDAYRVVGALKTFF
ncbi:amino acid deaminase [Asticcacaulis sp. EMRT-3]|uniref:amino acid deaminase n=1 Tax=Asticcacaulis sp. EMRT-3 TaxID=3040349 RepID=UPI0024AF68DF|nr:amino acid deaminase [Asticcacaulis sp. EMRT-3]MDI7775758.1 amino acid deaminase [Asticcacaulis sp. EMRT-3]